MAGIYNRDNYAQLMQTALNNAYNRREATQRERAERVKEIVNAGGDFAKVIGRTAEEWDVPDQYKDNPDYKAARFDYIISGDRSGLDGFRQAELQAEQRAFQERENDANRKFQARENDKNRAIQRQQHGLEKITERARLLRDVRDAEAILADMEGENKSKYSEVDRAKARNNLALTRSMLTNSGQFTAAELAGLNGESVPSASSKPLDVQIAEAKANGWQVPAQEPTEANGDNKPAVSEDPAESWNKFYARNVEIKGADDKKLDELEAEFGKHKKDEANADEYEKFKKDMADQRKSNKNARAAKQKASAKTAFAQQFIQDGGISKTELRNALGMNQKGGGKTEAKLSKSWNYEGKTESMDIEVKRDGMNVKLYVDGKYVGDMNLGF